MNSPAEKQPDKMTKLKTYFKQKCMFAPLVDADPRLLPPRVKTGIVACVALVACTTGFASTIYFPGTRKNIALEQIKLLRYTP